jgi:hypothetical protein
MENWNKYLKEQEGAVKPKLIFLIGPPSVGKSEWVKKNMAGDFLVLSRDDIVEKVAFESGVGTYDDMYKRPPGEILPQPLPGPEDPQKVEQYLASLQATADKFNKEHPDEAKQFGPVAPLTVEKYIKGLTPRAKGGYGIPMTIVDSETGEKKQAFVPLHYPKIEKQSDAIQNQFEEARSAMAVDKKDVVIDMLNMSLDEREGHRIDMAKAIAESPVKDAEKARQIIDEKFDQLAYVFADSIEGWSDEEKEKIKRSAEVRAGEIAQEPYDPEDPEGPKRSKTIPPGAFDRFFGTYAPPQPTEGFVTDGIKLVGMPALERL